MFAGEVEAYGSAACQSPDRIRACVMSSGQTDADRLNPTFSSAIADARNYMNWIVSTMRPYLGKEILEVGIGHGSYCEYLAGFGRYRGIDIDPQNVRNSSSRFPDRSFHLADICSEQFRSEYPPGSVDTVVCCNVIEHIEDDRHAVSNLVNALSVGGHLVLLVPAHQALYGD